MMPVSDWFVLALVAACVALVVLASIRSRRTSPKADIVVEDALARRDGTENATRHSGRDAHSRSGARPRPAFHALRCGRVVAAMLARVSRC